jgi:hypothetical protein
LPITNAGTPIANGGTSGADYVQIIAGTNQISGVLPANPAGGAVAKSTFGTAWGAFGYGFSPSNSTTAGGPTTIQQPCLPLYEAAYPQSNGNPTPPLAGPNGQADLTISDESLLIDSANGLPAPATFRRSIR